MASCSENNSLHFRETPPNDRGIPFFIEKFLLPKRRRFRIFAPENKKNMNERVAPQAIPIKPKKMKKTFLAMLCLMTTVAASAQYYHRNSYPSRYGKPDTYRSSSYTGATSS